MSKNKKGVWIFFFVNFCGFLRLILPACMMRRPCPIFFPQQPPLPFTTPRWRCRSILAFGSFWMVRKR